MDSALWAQWLEAIGTLLAVIVALGLALFQDKIRAWFSRPKLHVSLTLAPPDCHKTMMHYSYTYRGGVSMMDRDPREYARGHDVETYYFRLRVSNTGNQRAESVEVFASKLSLRQADGTYKVVESFLPMNLLWSHFREVFLPAISPHTHKHCDLGHILKPQDREATPGEYATSAIATSDRTILSLDTAVQPYTQSHLLPPGTYRLEIVVAAANAQAVVATLEITLTGDWYNDERQMLGQGIGIRVLP